MHPLLLSVTLAAQAAAGETAEKAAENGKQVVELDPVSLILNASGPVFVVVWMLIFASVLVWFVAVLKLMQIRRWRATEGAFEKAAEKADDAESLFSIAARHKAAAGARVVMELQKRRDVPAVLDATAKRALVNEQRRASTLMPTLASIGSASPFIGLFGTVYGIMDAFLRIGREKSASLPVVAPAIGEALIATAIGLFAAIPAVIAYNAISKRLDDLLAGIEASAEGWVNLVLPGQVSRTTLIDESGRSQPLPMTQQQQRNNPPAFPGA